MQWRSLLSGQPQVNNPAPMALALIMAGGRSSRMRESVPRHKGMVEVLGLSMLERNLLMLVSHGFRDIVVAIGEREQELIGFARRLAGRLPCTCDVTMNIFVERRPLGTIGAARPVGSDRDNVLVVNVDNLTSLDLAALVARHNRTRAAMTIATHCEPFSVPFGQVSVRRGSITDYKEKPVLPVVLSSGTYVLGPAARQSIPSGRTVGAPELVHILLRSQQKVAAFPHSSPWIDVNDSTSIQRAEALIAANFRDFELWREPADRQVLALGILKDQRIAAMVQNSHHHRTTQGRLPSRELRAADNNNVIESACHLGNEIGLQLHTLQLLASFDQLDWDSGERIRHHLVVGDVRAGTKLSTKTLPSGLHWLELHDLSKSHCDARTLAYLQRHLTSQSAHSLRD